MENKITAGGIEIPIISIYERTDRINEVNRDIIDVITSTPLTEEQLTALKTGEWDIQSPGSAVGTFTGYSELVQYHNWFAKPLGDAEMVQQLEAEKVQLTQEKDQLASEKQALQEENQTITQEKEEAVQASVAFREVIVPKLLQGRRDDTLAEFIAYLPEWTPGPYKKDDVRKWDGQPYTSTKEHDSTGNPQWTPDTTPSEWFLYHAKSAEHALPFKAVTGAHDMYKVNEYMLYTDDIVYKCVEDTAYSPTDYPQAWEAVINE